MVELAAVESPGNRFARPICRWRAGEISLGERCPFPCWPVLRQSRYVSFCLFRLALAADPPPSAPAALLRRPSSSPRTASSRFNCSSSQPVMSVRAWSCDERNRTAADGKIDEPATGDSLLAVVRKVAAVPPVCLNHPTLLRKCHGDEPPIVRAMGLARVDDHVPFAFRTVERRILACGTDHRPPTTKRTLVVLRYSNAGLPAAVRRRAAKTTPVPRRTDSRQSAEVRLPTRSKAALLQFVPEFPVHNQSHPEQVADELGHLRATRSPIQVRTVVLIHVPRNVRFVQLTLMFAGELGQHFCVKMLIPLVLATEVLNDTAGRKDYNGKLIRSRERNTDLVEKTANQLARYE